MKQADPQKNDPKRAGSTTRRVVRITREGFRRVFHPTIEELEDAIDEAIVAAGRITWDEVRHVEDFYGARIRATLGVAVRIERAGHITETGARVLAISTDQLEPVHLELSPEIIGGPRQATTPASAKVTKL